MDVEDETYKEEEEEEEENSSDPYAEIVTLRRTRGTHKRKITSYFKKLKELHDKKTLTSSFCKTQIKEIDKEVTKIKKYDDEINKIMETNEIDLTNEGYYNVELDSQADYNIQIGLQLDEFEEYISESSSASGNISAEKVLDMMSKLNMSEGKPPPLECGTFSGKEKDKFAFNNFLNQFNNVIGSRKNLSDSAKQTYLYGYLRDYALKVVKHLNISDSNYHLAIKMLKQEFLDVEYIIDETFRNILKATPSVEFDPEYTSVKIYLNEIKAYLYELKEHKIDS